MGYPGLGVARSSLCAWLEARGDLRLKAAGDPTIQLPQRSWSQRPWLVTTEVVSGFRQIAPIALRHSRRGGWDSKQRSVGKRTKETHDGYRRLR